MKKIITTALATMVAVYGYSQTLQSVTDAGKITTNEIIIQGNNFAVASGPTTSGGYSGLQITPTGTNANGGYTSINSFYSGIGWSSPLVLQNYGAGNVGIGITNPQSKLHINNGVVTAGEYSVVLRGRYSDVYPSSGMNNGYFELRTNNEDAYSGGMSVWTNYGSTMYERLKVASSGNVGIGTSTPVEKLDVTGNLRVTKYALSNGNLLLGSGSSGAMYPYLAGTSEISQIGIQLDAIRATNQSSLTGYSMGAIYLNTAFNATSGNLLTVANNNLNKFVVNYAGDVGIGTTDPKGYKLAVAGKIRATEIKVEALPWSDFVFEPSYKLRDLKSTEQFIKENKHLPEIPSAAEVAKDGINVGEMNAKLLQKIEELTLYMIEQNKRSEQQDKIIQLQNERIENLEKQNKK